MIINTGRDKQNLIPLLKLKIGTKAHLN